MFGIPVLNVKGTTIPDAWEKSLIELEKNGCRIKTQYDKEQDPASLDCTMGIIIKNPWQEPMIHRCMPGTLQDLGEYVEEVIKGTNDHKIEFPRKENGHLYYTYHSRLRNQITPYLRPENLQQQFDQIKIMIEELSKVPYTRRAQAVTWIVSEDVGQPDPPCLQSIWCRMIEQEGKWYLNMNTRWRSRDAYRAAFMNIFAMIHLQKYIADEISKIIEKEVLLGRYFDLSDSYHIYGYCLEDFKTNFLKIYETRLFENRVWYLEKMRKYVFPMKGA